MRLLNKALIIAVLTALSFLIISLFIINHSILIISLAIASSVIVLAAIYLTIIKRIEKLNQHTNNIVVNNKLIDPENIPQEKDEINSITFKVDSMLKHIQESQLQLENTIKKATESLQEKNIYLQQEISARTRSEKIVLNKDYFMQLGLNDNVTSLPSGVFFNETLNRAINHAKRRNQILAILLIDIDKFKEVNETLGRGNGNLILNELGKRFTNVLRKEDVLAKLEGDEYIILLTDIKKPKFASMVAAKILNICSQLLKVDSHEFSLTASIGICVYPNDGQSLEELIENADRALFKVKKANGNAYRFYTEEMHVEALEYIKLESALRKAVSNNEIALYYQPMFRIKTGTITGVEALMRWEHPELGIISPENFIQLAEDSGLMMEIGEWALHEACQRIRYWQNDGYEHLTISLKLSPKQFNHPDIVKVITKVIEKVNINPKYIEFEITEKTVMDNVASSSNILEKIKATGVQLSIDHFGVGYTSISYLKQFPINSIKIDKSYIKGVPNIPNDSIITSALIALAHHLGLEVIAEGVESAEQIQYLSSQSCDIVQGYFLSHPVSAQKIVLQFKKLQEEVF